jgi:uncharacterized protein (TIGR00255 family)
VIRSMTGFGDASLTVGGVHYYLELRSLNSKYFKAVIRLPAELQSLEAELETELRHRLNRGSVFMTVSFSDSSGGAAHTINPHALAKYIAQVKAVPQVASGSVNLDLGSLLHLPGVLQPPADEEVRVDAARKVVLDLCIKGCEGLINMREREGKILVDDLLTHRDDIAERLRLIETRSPIVSAEYERRLRTRIHQMLKEHGVALTPINGSSSPALSVDTIDVVREIAVWAERSDISEEIARLSGHIEQFAQMLSEPKFKPIGRTLDFLTQEMLREANTIASKCGDAEISRWTVEIKGSIDRIKEQVQNVE